MRLYLIIFLILFRALFELQFKCLSLLLRRQWQERPRVAAHSVAHLVRLKGRVDGATFRARDALVEDAPIHLGASRTVHLRGRPAGHPFTGKHLSKGGFEGMGIG